MESSFSSRFSVPSPFFYFPFPHSCQSTCLCFLFLFSFFIPLHNGAIIWLHGNGVDAIRGR